MSTGIYLFDPPISVNLRDGGTKEFSTLESLVDFYNFEYHTWSKLFNDMRANKPYNQDYTDEIENLLRNINKNISAALNSEEDSTDHRRSIKSLRNDILAYFSKPTIIPLSSIQGQRLVEIAETDIVTASVFFAQLIKLPIAGSSITDSSAYFRACSIIENESRNIDSTLSLQNEAFVDLRNKWDNAFNELSTNYDKKYQFLIENKKRLKKTAFSLLRSYRDVRENHEKDFAAQRQEFSTEMKLRAGEAFWKEKKEKHDELAELAFSRLKKYFMGGGISLMLFYALISQIITPEPTNLAAYAFLFGLPTVLMIWLFRLLVREYRVNKDLAEDAAERAAMVLTFKALEHDEHVSDAERAIVLQALFRPHDAIGDDAGVPNPVWEAILGKLNKP